MTDERMVNLAAALLFEASTAAQAETMRLGAPLDDTQLALVTARAVETTMSVFRREEIAVGEQQLAVFLTALAGATLRALLTMQATVGAMLERSAAQLAEATARITQLEAAIVTAYDTGAQATASAEGR